MDRSVTLSGQIIFIWLFLLLLQFPCMAQDKQLPYDSTLIQFEMEDQFGRKYSERDFMGDIVILVGSDREGSQYNEPWSLAIYESLKRTGMSDSVKFLPVADLRGVPFFLKGYVKSKFPSEKKRWILMDWSGKFASAYRFEPEHSNILLFDREGVLIYRMSVQKVQEDRKENFLQQIFFLSGISSINYQENRDTLR